MKEKEKVRNPNRKREKETGIFSMIGFDTAASSFLTLLIKKSYREKLKAKLKSFQLCNKKFKTILSRKFCQVTHLRDLKSFVGR